MGTLSQFYLDRIFSIQLAIESYFNSLGLFTLVAVEEVPVTIENL